MRLEAIASSDFHFRLTSGSHRQHHSKADDSHESSANRWPLGGGMEISFISFLVQFTILASFI